MSLPQHATHPGSRRRLGTGRVAGTNRAPGPPVPDRPTRLRPFGQIVHVRRLLSDDGRSAVPGGLSHHLLGVAKIWVQASQGPIDPGLGLSRGEGRPDGLLLGANGIQLGLQAGAGEHQLFLGQLESVVLVVQGGQLIGQTLLAQQSLTGKVISALLESSACRHCQ